MPDVVPPYGELTLFVDVTLISVYLFELFLCEMTAFTERLGLVSGRGDARQKNPGCLPRCGRLSRRLTCVMGELRDDLDECDDIAVSVAS